MKKNKILNVMNKLSLKINKNFSDYNIFSHIEKYIVKNDKKNNYFTI